MKKFVLTSNGTFSKNILTRFYFLLLFIFYSPFVLCAKEAQITILFTNDHHGQVEPIHESDQSKPVGGVTRRMALIKKIRQEVGEKNVILVDSGDLFRGTAFSEMTDGKVDCAAYQLMRYDAIGLGEQDFDYGKKTLLDYRKEFSLPWVSANVVSAGQPFIRPYVLKTAGNIRVGLIGFSTQEALSVARRENVRGLIFNPPDAAAKGLHSIFKKDADIFVVLSRLGVDTDKKFAKGNSYLHVILGGRSQTVLTAPIVTKTKDGSLVGPIIGQAGSQGLYLGRLDLSIEGHRDPKTKNATYSITDYHYELIPITADLPEDADMAALLDKYRSRLKQKPLDEPLAESLNADANDQGDSVWGQLAADEIRKETQADAALINSDFFHSDFKTGIVTREILYEMLPTDNEIVTVEIPGAYLRKVLEIAELKRGQGAFLQISGLRVQREGDSFSIQIGNEPLKDRQKYQLALNDFLADGGDGYEQFRRLKYRKRTDVMIRELMENALKARKKIVSTDLDKRWIFQ
jgi:2',3'-cyclic-nucleotide 2'-phosphodiesterase (5'-nucleotidase family)